MIITQEREIRDILRMRNKLIPLEWISKDMILVNCNPYYSSIVTQLMNHGLCPHNNGELFEQVNLEIPKEGEWKVWDMIDDDYVPYDTYILSWIRKNILPDTKYLFISHDICEGKPYKKLFSALQQKLESEMYKFISPYVEKSCTFKPDLFIEEYEGRKIFEWECPKNFKTKQNVR